MTRFAPGLPVSVPLGEYMKSYILVITLLAPLFVHANEVDCENAMTTYAMNICAGREMESADARLARYIAAAKEKYSAEPGVVEMLDRSQDDWLVYRKSYCDAIYEIWSDGTIRGAMFSDCMLQLTEQRTHNIWSDYLTYMDSTPPVLPEPN